VLIADDEADVRLGLRLLLEPMAGEIREAESGEQALEILAEWTPHVLLSDITMGTLSGMDLLAQVHRHRPEIRILMITGYGTIELAVEAMRRGAAHFLTKPFDNREILAEVERQGRRALVAEGVRRLAAAGAQGTPAIIAQDPRMLEILDLVERVGATRMPVLIEGESGTGKELVARAIHQHSRDPALPFLAVNAAALPDTLLESELFGHVKGAFTGAQHSHLGIFAQARGGTVFLDEIALMSPAFQGKLLRVLQEHTVIPLGSSTPQPVAFRLVAATNRNLRQLIEAGEFREDLYYRLQVVTMHLPPLRERPQDIVPLAMHFLVRYSAVAGLAPGVQPALSSGALEALQSHAWPGNVRELENAIQRALILCRGEDIQPWHLSLDEESDLQPAEAVDPDLSYEEGKQQVLESYRRHTVERALKATAGNVSQAAELCDLSRAAFQRILRQLDIDRSRFSEG
jgi:DNA-binding NtrC family response regulator